MANRSHFNQATLNVRLARISALLPLALFFAFCRLVTVSAAGGVWRFSRPWVPGINVNGDMAVDALAVLFGLIISGIGAFVVLFAADYMRGHRYYGRFFTFLHLFMLSMLGLVVADNLISLFIFWELTTVFSYLLIGFENENQASRDSARQALLVTGAGGLAMLIGFLMIGGLTGTYRISALANDARMIQVNDLYLPILIAVFAGAFTKSAQFPFHFWLPNAMTAPTPVSAFLHSATMVNAGIYLLARFHPVLGGTDAWMGTLVVVGGVTALWGALLSIGQSDLKRLLAYSTIMALGILTMFLGGQTTPAVTAAVTFLLVHALYKSALFLVVGIIDHETGTRDVADLSGLIRDMPITGVGASAAAMSMAGFPLFLGFIGKEIMYKGALTETMFPAFATTIALTSNALMTAAAGILLVRTFFGRPRATPRPPHEPPIGMWLGPLCIAGLGLVFGIIPDWVGQWLVQPAVAAFHPTLEPIALKLFYGFNEPLLLSVLTLILGASIYLLRQRIQRWIEVIASIMPVSGDRVYNLAMAVTAHSATLLTGFLQNGSLHRYLLTIFSAFVLCVGGIWVINAHGRVDWLRWPALPLWQAVLSLLIIAAVITAVRARSRVLAIGALGVVGTGAALIFLVYGAPDLALTQLLVETLTLIIASIVLLRLPSLERPGTQRRHQRWVDAMVAVGTGTLVACLVLATGGGPIDRQLTDFYEQHSYLAAHGRNIVNVILVDFRGMDTLGEIVVVATAGLAGFSLLVRRRK
jgi:multicomponent Na+:H+ antiporter subunit A